MCIDAERKYEIEGVVGGAKLNHGGFKWIVQTPWVRQYIANPLHTHIPHVDIHIYTYMEMYCMYVNEVESSEALHVANPLQCCHHTLPKKICSSL